MSADPNRPLTPDERARFQALSMGQPMPSPPPDPFPNGPPPPPPPAAAPAAKSKFWQRSEDVNPLDVAKAQEELDRPSPPRPPLPVDASLGQVWNRILGRDDAPPPPPPPKPAAYGPQPAPAVPADVGSKYGPGAAGAGGINPTEQAAPEVNWNRGGGGTATIPAHEVAVVSKKRQDEVTGAIDAEAKAIEGQKDAVTDTHAAMSDTKRQEAEGERGIAKAAKDAGEEAKSRVVTAREESKAYLKHINEFSAQIANDKIDPNRMYENASTAQKVTWTIASMFGAAAQGLLHQSTNQVADKIEAMAAADVAAQRAQHEINRGRLGDMHSLYGHAMQTTHDAEAAERVATGYALEAAKHEADALTKNAQGAEQVARGQELREVLTERQALLGEKKAEKGIQYNPLVQAKTVATGPDMKEIYKSARAYTEEQAKLGTVVPPDAAIQWAYKMHTGANPLPGRPFVQGAKEGVSGAGGMTAEQRGKLAQEQQQTQTAADEFNRQIASLRTHPVITGAGLGTAVGAHLPQRLAPESNDAQQQLHAINTQMLQAIGKVAKDADGKPNKAMIEKIEQKFEMHLGEPPELRQQKLNGIADVYNALAREQGAKAPEPHVGPAPTFEK